MGLETHCHQSQGCFLKPVWVLGGRNAFAIWVCTSNTEQTQLTGQGLEPEEHVDIQARGTDLM